MASDVRADLNELEARTVDQQQFRTNLNATGGEPLQSKLENGDLKNKRLPAPS